MSDTLMALGPFRFSLGTAAYHQLKKHFAYRWATLDRLDGYPARQFVGLGSETLDIIGTLLPHFQGGLDQLDRIKALAGNGEPLSLVDGRGYAWGLWIVLDISEIHTFFVSNGLPRKIAFTLKLAQYGEDTR